MGSAGGDFWGAEHEHPDRKQPLGSLLSGRILHDRARPTTLFQGMPHGPRATGLAGGDPHRMPLADGQPPW